MMQFVHIDLKGAPFRPRPFGNFWECFCAMLSKWGATGIILEWEDSVEIPLFENDLDTFAYTYGEAGWIVETAQKNNLQVIPLVQTFGHLEYILKYDKRKYLREDPDFPNCLAAIDKRQFETDPSFKLVTTLIDQIIELTPNCPAIHLGGDEVWQLGTGPKSQSRMRTNPSLSRDQIYLEHMTVVVKYVRAKYPEKRILIWDDMLRHMSYQSLISWGDQLLDMVEPVVWNYTTQPSESLNDDLWTKYQQIFRMMWIGTAFKGASGPNAQFTPVQLHVTNHLEWLKLIEEKKYIMPRNIQGWILTGWQRFDHFASLCELLPVGLPSLCCCLAAIQSHHFGDAQITFATNELGIDMSSEFGNGSSPFSNNLLPTYPGGQLFSLMQEYSFTKAEYNNFISTETFATWFNDYYVERRRISPLQARSIRASLENYSSIFQNLEHSIKNSLCQVYPNPVVSEWLGAYIKPITRDLAEKLRKTYSVIG